MFNIGDYVVCSAHGVGQVCDVEVKEMGEATQSFYIIKLVSNGMKVMMPTCTKDGIRSLVEEKEVGEVFTLLQDHEVKLDTSTWNRRYRDYMLKVKSGSLLEIADVLRSLFLLKNTKKLSFGEKKMLDQCRELLVKEISLSQGLMEKEVTTKIEACFEQ